MEEEDACHAVCIYAREVVALSFGNHYQSQDETQIGNQQSGRTEESPFFAHGAEDKVGVLLGYKAQFGLCALQETFACELSGTDGDE